MTPEQRAEFDALEAADAPPAAKNMSIAQGNDLADRDAFRETFDEGNTFDQFMTGVGKAPLQAYYGAKGLLGLTDAEDEQTLRMLEETHGPAALAGEVVGDVAMLALPGAGVAKGAQAITKTAPRLVQAGTILGAESALAGAAEGVKAPETGETRRENAEEAAKWSMILGAPFAGLRHAKAPVSDAAQELLADNVPITPGMTGGKIREGAEKFMSVIPGLSGKVKKMQDAALDKWNAVTLDKTRPPSEQFTAGRPEPVYSRRGPEVKPGREGFQQVQDDFKEAYNEVWSGVTPESLRPDAFLNATGEAAKLLDGLPADSLPAAQKSVDKLVDTVAQFEKTGDYRLIENMDDVLRTTISASEDQLTSGFYKSLRNSLRDGIDPDAVKMLSEVDSAYRDFSVLEKAASYVSPQEHGAIFTPRNLQSAVKAKNSPRATTTGKGAMQKEADTATNSLANVMSGRSEISVGEDIGKWGTLLGVGASGGGALIPLAGARAGLNEGMRKFLTGTAMHDLKLPAHVERMMRNAGVSRIDQIEDPVYRRQVVDAVESELGASEQ